MKTYEVEITGRQYLLMHAYDYEWAAEMTKWAKDPDNKALSKAGDDRTPPHRWLGYLYRAGTLDDSKTCVAMPNANIYKALLHIASDFKPPNGKGQKTMKGAIAAQLIFPELHWKFLVGEKPVDTATLWEIATASMSPDDFDDQIPKIAEAFPGMTLDVRPVAVQQSTHIRVRPRFDGWSVRGEVQVEDGPTPISRELLQAMFTRAGQMSGLGDWRPSAKKSPGMYGRFDVTVRPVKEKSRAA